MQFTSPSHNHPECELVRKRKKKEKTNNEEKNIECQTPNYALLQQKQVKTGIESQLMMHHTNLGNHTASQLLKNEKNAKKTKHELK